MIPALPLGVVLAIFVGVSDLTGSAAVLTGRRLLGPRFDYLLAYGSGFALAIVVSDLIPASLSAGTQNAFWVLAGFCTMYLLDRWLKDADDPSDTVLPADLSAELGSDTGLPPRGVLSGVALTMVGVSLCAFFDGVAVASAVAVTGATAMVQSTTATGTGTGASAGWLLLAGLFPHKFLEGASIALLLLGAGVARHTVWLWAVVLALASPLGGLAVQLALSPTIEASLQGFAAGLLLHLVASERVPGFRGPLQKVQALVFVAGVATYALTASFL